MKCLSRRKPRRVLKERFLEMELKKDVSIINGEQEPYFESSSVVAQQIDYAAQTAVKEVDEDYQPSRYCPSIFPVLSTELSQDPNDTWMDFLSMEERLAVYGMQDNFDFEYKRATEEDILHELGMHIESPEHQEALEAYDFS